jgi:drug/metabolite transporter (DMT)-like permease
MQTPAISPAPIATPVPGMNARRQALTGALFALAAGLLWGLVFVVPLLLPQYPAPLLSFARYLAFGLIALPLAWLDRQRLAQLSRADWVEALKLGAVGNVLYYFLLAAAIQNMGTPLPAMVIGTLPVVIAISSNWREARIGRAGGRAEVHWPWRHLAPSLLLLAAGVAAVNHVEWARAAAQADHSLSRYAGGLALAVGALLCWTWYPLRNATWLRAQAGRSASTWATAQGVATLPLALLGFVGYWIWNDWSAGATGIGGVVSGSTASQAAPFLMPWGPEPALFIGLMLCLGLLASWLGTLCWNEASQRLPPAVSGQLIVFETLAALAYAFVLRGEAPGALTLLGAALLIAGVLWALRAFARPAPSKPER